MSLNKTTKHLDTKLEAMRLFKHKIRLKGAMSETSSLLFERGEYFWLTQLSVARPAIVM